MKKENIIKIIITGLTALGSFTVGYFIRQPEVSQLKKEVYTLKKDLLDKMLKVEAELERQVDELNTRYLALKTYQFAEKQELQMEYEKKQEEVFYMKCCCSEYIRLLGKSKIRQENLSSSEEKFVEVFGDVLNNKYSSESNEYIKSYVSKLDFDKNTVFDLRKEIEKHIVA